MNNLKAELQRLYADASRHSTYQHVPDFVTAELGYVESIDEAWRGDRPRLAYVLGHRKPRAAETWLDFGANTGFFTLSLAREFPLTTFVAVEANAHHARFINLIAGHFRMDNVRVINQAIGLRELHTLPKVDVLLHFNVLHHAGHDFDADLVPDRDGFPGYARDYLARLHDRADTMLFQMGSNWGGDKNQPLVGTRDDARKLQLFAGWLRAGGWDIAAVAYPARTAGPIEYIDLNQGARQRLLSTADPGPDAHDWRQLDHFPGEFHRRPVFLCNKTGHVDPSTREAA